LRKRSLVLLRLGLVLVSVLVALVSVEALVRVRQWLQTGHGAAEPYSLVQDPASGLWIPTPGQVNGPIRINRDGFRGPDVPRVTPAGTIRLAFLGGSTTFCAEVSGNDATWPAQLTEALRARHPGVSFDYLNAGVPGYGMGSIRATLERRVAPFRPDVIVLYEGTNDMASDTRAVAARQGLFHDLTADPSPLAKISVTWYLIERRMIARRRQEAASSGIVLPYNVDSLARVYEERVVGVLRSARAVAPVCVVATFSHKMRRGQPPAVALANSAYSMYYSLYQTVDGLIRMYDAYNDAVRRAAHSTGAILVDGEDDIPADDRHFTDSVHFTDEGARAMAARVLRGLEESPDFRALVAAKTSGRTPPPRP
jgi:lysophospholipase L1-like esterase